MSKIAFIGLGNMGLPMAKNLVAAGHDVAGFDLSAEAKSALKEAGGAAADTIAAAVSAAEVIVSMLPAGKHVSAVYTEAEGVLAQAKAGALLIDSSTIDVDTARAVSAQAEVAGFAMVDAPVSGGVGGAAAGTLTFMVGGTATSFAAAKPYLDIMGQNIFHAGAAGNGQVAKICNNMLLGISMIGTAEAFTLGENLGLDAQPLFDISSTASGQCWRMPSYCPAPGPVPTSPANNDYQAGFTAAMMLKDLLLAQEASASASAATPMGQRAAELYTQMADAGHAELDFSGIIKEL
ncbi:MAG: 3-hydroxyisobutyrate dehydrogenase [Alphaproteobacteria bacterium]|nr:3-hydroxyisobutyrate dehydrogenase [Alphaproteobacteria bacterium]